LSFARRAKLDGQPTTKHRKDVCQTEQTEGVCSNRVSDAVPTTPGEAKKPPHSAPNVRKPGTTWLSQVFKKVKRDMD
jgi:hypothetical protein